MHTVQHRNIIFERKFCRRHVGQQHALFNQFMRIITGSRQDFLNPAEFVEGHIGFDGFKFHSMTLGT